MVGQKPLTAFFKPLNNGGVKRTIAQALNIPDTLENKNPQQQDSESAPLTPDAKKRMLGNRLQAKIKLQHKSTPALHFSIGESWFEAIEPEFKKPYFEKLSEHIVNERSKNTVYPPEDQVWAWTHHIDIQKIKVVIIGQDPYHGPGQAHGLCFSVPKGIRPPPSLVNIYKEMAQDIDGFQIPNHGNLTGWAKQGVLLLNACLTVRAHAANSHKDKGWELLTSSVIKWISDNSNGVVFLLWGSYAQKKAEVVNKKNHHLLYAPHPSPLSAHRGFLGCKHFSKCNELLLKQGNAVIDWSKLSDI